MDGGVSIAFCKKIIMDDDFFTLQPCAIHIRAVYISNTALNGVKILSFYL